MIKQNSKTIWNKGNNKKQNGIRMAVIKDLENGEMRGTFGGRF